MLRQIAADPGIELHVLFERLDTAGTYFDTGFGTEVTWDVPLTEGYDFAHAPNLAAVTGPMDHADVLWVHGWDTMLKRRCLEAARRRGLPVLMRGENTMAAMPDGTGLRGVLKRAYLRWIFYRCWGFLCIGRDNRDYYRAHGIDEARLFSMPYAVDNGFFRAPTDKVAALRAELGLEAGRPVVLFAGKLQRRKNPEMLLAAVRAMSGPAPYLLFVGDGEQSEAISAQAGDDGTVHMLGFRNQRDLPAFYALADVFVLPSEREPWGLAVNEAMAAGTAVIATDQCGSAADLIDADCGRVVGAGDVPALTRALEDILGAPDRVAAMGAAARARIQSWSFDADVEGLKSAMTAVVSWRSRS